MHDTDFQILLNTLGLSWTGYRRVRKGVKRRISRHMQAVGVGRMDLYIKRLWADPSVRSECDRLMTVSISRFFRDRHLWDTLEKVILPDIIKKHPSPLNIWSAGCACGEEAYSMALLWKRLKQKESELPALEILATDMNPDYLQKARTGSYPLSSLKVLDNSDLELFFQKTSGRNRYSVSPALQKYISWRSHHLLDDAPASGFQIIFLRNNVLTYYKEPLKRIAFRNVIRALAPSGLLVIGSHEVIPKTDTALRPVQGFSHVWIKDG